MTRRDPNFEGGQNVLNRPLSVIRLYYFPGLKAQFDPDIGGYTLNFDNPGVHLPT